MNDAYSPLKALRHLDVIQGARKGRPVRPVHVQVILSDLCNQACHHCAYRDPTYSSSKLFYQIDPALGRGLRRETDHPERNYNPNRMIPYEKVIEILDDCAAIGTEAIQLTGGGEPTVHPRFREIVEHVVRLGLKFSLVTNGINVVKKGYADLLAEATWVRVSLDAGDAETYGRTRSVPSEQFRVALEAIRQLRHAVYRAETETVVGVGFVVTPENWREVVQATKAAKDAGADNIRISAQFSSQDEKLFVGFHEKAAILCQTAEGLGDERFTVFNRFGEKLADLRQKAPDYDLCGYQHFTTYIGADLNVYRCCVWAYNERGLIGSLHDRRFRDFWMSQERADEMAEGAFDARGCDRCQFNSINRTLDYALRRDEPLHKEFV